tara:strand:- start:1433 stop:1876 length:444 start_codon:yes stop_codon:yes gene_type:complete
MQIIRTIANNSLTSNGSNPISIIPKNDIKINNHCFKDAFSFRKRELSNIANGIASCDPIIIGEIMDAFFSDNVINKFAKKPINREKQNRGNQYFFSGILNFQKGNKKIKTINILMLPISNGGTELLNIIFCIGYALPKRKVIIKIKI